MQTRFTGKTEYTVWAERPHYLARNASTIGYAVDGRAGSELLKRDKEGTYKMDAETRKIGFVTVVMNGASNYSWNILQCQHCCCYSCRADMLLHISVDTHESMDCGLKIR